ncbi:tubulin-specific chaperone A [Aethina tumida]|uniref:tubulin-specific chaperone A n=1 Tax=Aethina tumida TaxID=116153 RepID=UPI00096B20EA|nr:tubulin-specific chaperone A [Aethina tumida]
MADPRIRTIKIKAGVAKRLAKEKTVYEKEAEQQRARIEKYKQDGKDEYEIRKQEEVLQESLMMVPDCQRRLKVAYDELVKILETEADLAENEEYINAKKILEDAKLQLPSSTEVITT